MSWSINAVGYRSAVKAKVLADQCIPAGLKSTIADLCDEPNPNTNGIQVLGHGHSGGGYGSIGKLEVMNVQILEPAVVNVNAAIEGEHGPGV